MDGRTPITIVEWCTTPDGAAEQFTCMFQTIYVVIVIFLFTTGLYDIRPKPESAFNYGVVTNEIDLEGFKVLTAIIVHTLCALCLMVSMMANNITRCSKVLPPIVIIIILFFNMIFNLAGCLCLWIHHAPNFPEGYAHSIRGTAALSSFAVVYTIVAAIIYCFKYPHLPSGEATMRAVDKTSLKVSTPPKEGTHESREASKDAAPAHPGASLEAKDSKEKLAMTQAGVPEDANHPFDKTPEGKSVEKGSKEKVQQSADKPSEKAVKKTQEQPKSLQSFDMKTLQPTMEMPDKDYFGY